MAFAQKYGDGSDTSLDKQSPFYESVMDNLSPTFRRIIIAIAEGQGHPVANAKIIRRTNLSSAELSMYVRKLADEGIVKRIKDEKDRRLASYVLTIPDFYGLYALRSDPAFHKWIDEHPDALESGFCVKNFLESSLVSA